MAGMGVSPRRTAALAATTLVAVGLAACGNEPPDVEVPSGEQPAAVWGEPSGQFEGERPKAVLMLIHGGGWEGVDRRLLQATLAQAPIYEALGFATMTIDYRAGAQGLDDVERFYDQARKRAGQDTPVCAVGGSAGGHLALLLAEREPSLDCVVAEVSPTDLTSLRTSGVSDAKTATKIAVTAFGKDGLARFSPALHADSIRAEVFLLYSQNDPLIAPEQGEAMKRALPQATLVVLGPGDRTFGHITQDQAAGGGGVDPGELDEARQDETAFLERVAAEAGS
jgi:acetyl esterase/lipase